MSHAAMSVAGKMSAASASLPEQQLGLLKRLAFHLAPMADKHSDQTPLQIPRTSEDTCEPTGSMQNETCYRGRFLSSPPPFMVSASDQLCSIGNGSNKHDIWAPCVHFPDVFESNHSRGRDEAAGDDYLAAHMVLFEFLGFSFLVFVNLPSLDDDTTNSDEPPETTLLMMKLEEELSEAIIHAFHEESCEKQTDSVSASTIYTNEPGQDVVFVDRSKQNLVLLLDPKLLLSRRDAKKRMAMSNKRKSKMRRFMGLASMKNENPTPSQPSSHRSTRLEWSILGLDCRHLLASRLPLDICLAFDDMINEVTTVKQVELLSSPKGEGNDGETRSSTTELCTCIPYGWIYAHAAQEQEIYVFFDSSIYVTISDVQSAVLRIKERLMNDVTLSHSSAKY